MSTDKFIENARLAICQVVSRKHNEVFEINDIIMVWFAHTLGYKKGIFIDNGKNNRIYEVTYNRDKNEMYVDEYDKQSNTVFEIGDFV